MSTSFPAHATHVPIFYVPNHRYPKYLHILLLIALGSIFGGELYFCRTEALARRIFGCHDNPNCCTPFTLIVALVIIVKYGSDLDGFLANLTLFFSMLASPRLVLLGLALALVRHLPPTAYIAVNWTQVYPTSYKSIRVSVVTGPRTSPFWVVFIAPWSLLFYTLLVE